MTLRAYLLFICLGLCATTPSIAAQEGPASPAWEPVGFSGGGATFSPAISPADPDLMMLNCDMSAAYISEDGGHNWRMIHHDQLRSDIPGAGPPFIPAIRISFTRPPADSSA